MAALDGRPAKKGKGGEGQDTLPQEDGGGGAGKAGEGGDLQDSGPDSGPGSGPGDGPQPPAVDLADVGLSPVVAVLVQGDAALAAPFELELEARLRRSGLDVRDERNSPALRTLLTATTAVDLQTLPKTLLEAGFQVLVRVEIEKGQSRQIDLLSQKASLVAARVHINSDLLLTGKPIGPGWSELIEYTELSAGAKARRFMVAQTSELVAAIRRDWQEMRASRANKKSPRS